MDLNMYELCFSKLLNDKFFVGIYRCDAHEKIQIWKKEKYLCNTQSTSVWENNYLLLFLWYICQSFNVNLFCFDRSVKSVEPHELILFTQRKCLLFILIIMIRHVDSDDSIIFYIVFDARHIVSLFFFFFLQISSFHSHIETYE